jgi:circadian clock protein KaiB
MFKPPWICSQRLRAQFEGALCATTGRIHLHLYVAGLTPKSTRAIADVKRLCRDHLADRCDVEIIDIYQQPERAVEAQIIAVPTLVKSAPAPRRLLIGALTESNKVLKMLGLAA